MCCADFESKLPHGELVSTVPLFPADGSSAFLLAAVVDSSDDAIISKDLNGIITSWNRAAERMFGWTAAEAKGQPITIIIPSELHHQEVEILKRLREGERIEHLETVRQKKSGERVDVALTISPVRDGTGTVVGASKIARDITERKKAEAQLAATKDYLEKRVRERTAELWGKNAELAKQAETVRALSGRLLRTQDDERRRIARELHDSVGNLLAAMSMTLAKISRAKHELSAEVKCYVEELAALTEEVIKETRTVSHLLHPPLLDELGLGAAVRCFIEGFVQRSKIDVKFVTPPSFDRLNHDCELAIFRVIQECLTNIHRHSGSKTAKIYLLEKHGCVHCEISDSGKGISPDQQLALNSSATIGVGLRGMRERVSQLGGILEIHSNGKGTTVTVVLPLKRNLREPVDSSTESFSSLKST